MRLAVVATHPIQYYAPLFRLLAASQRLDLHVFYGWEGATRAALDPGFGQVIQWDIPLLDGYDYTFVPNDSRDPGTHHFFGIASSQLLPLVRAWAPDAVLVFGWNYQSHLQLLRRLHGELPIFFRGDSTLLDEQPGLRHLIRRVWLSWVYRHVDVALYVGTQNRRYYEAHGLTADRLAWAPHAIDNDRFRDGPDSCYTSQALAWRRSLGICDTDAAILFAGKLEPKKAPDILLEAFISRASPKRNEHLVFAGTGPLEAALRNRAVGCTNIHFLGFQNQSAMPVVYRLGDVFVLASRGPGETWGLAVNEAMACGRPVIVSDRVGCATDLVQSGQAGVVCRAGDHTALSSAIVALLRDPERRLKMRNAGMNVISSWSLAEQADRIERAVLEYSRKFS